MNETGRRVREQYADTGGFHRPRLRRLLDPRLRVRPAHPGPAVEAALRLRPRGRPEAPAPAGRRQGERGPDRPELGGHPARRGHHGRRGLLRPSQILRKLAAYPRQNDWSTPRPTTESPGSGETAACRAADPRPRSRRPDGLRAAHGDYDVVAVAEIDVGPAEHGDLAATKGAVEQQGDESPRRPGRGARRSAGARGRGRCGAGGGRWRGRWRIVGGEAAGLVAAAGGCVGRDRSPEPREGAPGERPDRHRSAGIAGGALDSGDHHRSGRGCAAGAGCCANVARSMSPSPMSSGTAARPRSVSPGFEAVDDAAVPGVAPRCGIRKGVPSGGWRKDTRQREVTP